MKQLVTVVQFVLVTVLEFVSVGCGGDRYECGNLNDECAGGEMPVMDGYEVPGGLEVLVKLSGTTDFKNVSVGPSGGGDYILHLENYQTPERVVREGEWSTGLIVSIDLRGYGYGGSLMVWNPGAEDVRVEWVRVYEAGLPQLNADTAPVWQTNPDFVLQCGTNISVGEFERFNRQGDNGEVFVQLWRQDCMEWCYFERDCDG